METASIASSNVFFIENLGFNRIAVSADGNGDPDDIGATPAGLAMLSHWGLQDRLVHYHINSQVWRSSSKKREKMQDSAYESAILMGFDPAIFFDAYESYQEGGVDNVAAQHLAEQINASSAEDQLLIVGAGPMEMVYQALELADADKRAFVKVLTHSHINDSNAGRNGGRTRKDIEGLGVSFISIPGQNPGFSTGKDFSAWSWLEERDNPNLRWIYDRMKESGKADISDAGMMYYALTGEEDGNIDRLKAFFDHVPSGETALPQSSSFGETQAAEPDSTGSNAEDNFYRALLSDVSEVSTDSLISGFKPHAIKTGAAEPPIQARQPEGLFIEATLPISVEISAIPEFPHHSQHRSTSFSDAIAFPPVYDTVNAVQGLGEIQ